MSRSRRKNPICGVTTAKSDKWCKQRSSRKFRRVKVDAFNEDQIMPTKQLHVSNRWQFNKDGFQIFDPVKNPELMRK